MTSKNYKFFEENLPDTIIEQIYYNENTDRSATVEHGAQAAGLIILEL